jgi:hypothetical protein
VPGLQLGANFGVAVPAAALPPSYAQDPSGGTISSRAYGIAGASAGGGPKTAAYGSVGAGLAGVAVLLWLWYSLPR